MNKKKNKKKITKQAIFNYISIFIVCIFAIYYLGRFIYYKIENDKPVIYSDILAEQMIEKIDKYAIEETLVLNNNTYTYVKEADNNYVKFGGYIWRVIRINKDNSITMISEDSIISLAYGNISNYNKSQINNWLNPINNEKHTGIFYSMISDNKEFLVNTKTCHDSFDDISSIGCFETDNDHLITLLSMKDYALAGGNSSYLNNGTSFWTTNKNNNNEFWYISEEGKAGNSDVDFEHGIRPVITLKPDVKLVSGTGSSDDPYIIKEHKPKILKDTYVGEYINLNNSLWRIVAKEDKSIKLVSEEYIKNSKDEDYQTYYSKKNNLSKLNDNTGVLYYLNNTYYKKFKEKDILVKGKFYNGTYDNNNNYNYKTVYSSSITAYVGLLSIAEPFSYNSENVFTMTRNINNELSIFIIDENKNLFEDSISNKHYIRPVIYVKNDITINNGDGTYLSPYILGSDKNE